jgi:hypothetical protein
LLLFVQLFFGSLLQVFEIYAINRIYGSTVLVFSGRVNEGVSPVQQSGPALVMRFALIWSAVISSFVVTDLALVAAQAAAQLRSWYQIRSRYLG